MLLTSLMDQAWFQGILIALGAGVAGLITWAFAMFQAWLNTKIKNEKLQTVSNTVLKLIKDTVLYINQVFVDQLKEDGAFNTDKQKEALQLALEKIKANLTKEAEDILNELYGNVEQWLIVQIEAIIAQL